MQVVNLKFKLFASGQAYEALSWVRSLNGLRLDELDCGKLSNENIANTEASKQMERLRIINVYEKNLFLSNFTFEWWLKRRK
jgi:hypothetical protein